MKILRPNGYKNTPCIRNVTCHMHVKKKFLQNKILFSVLAHYLAKRKFPPKISWNKTLLIRIRVMDQSP